MSFGACDTVGRWAQRAGNRIRLARWIGERAVHTARQGMVSAWEQGALTPDTTMLAVNAIGVHPPVDPPAGSAVDVGLATAAQAPQRGERTTSNAPEEPFDGYDALAAAHLVGRLSRLASGELAVARAYELNHRARRTVIAKIDQLLADRPAP